MTEAFRNQTPLCHRQQRYFRLLLLGSALFFTEESFFSSIFLFFCLERDPSPYTVFFTWILPTSFFRKNIAPREMFKTAFPSPK